MNKKTITNVIASMAILAFTAGAEASLFDKLKDKIKDKSKEKAEQLVDEKKGKTSQAASNESSMGLGDGPDKSLTDFTKCAGLELTNVMTGYNGDYTFQQGFSKESRSGFIQREKGSVKQGCILPSLQPQQLVYMEVDTKAFEAMGNSNDWAVQCVKSANPGAGAVNEDEPKSEYPYNVNYLSGKHLLLHCGHSESNAEQCAEGNNSSRSRKWDSMLEERGKTMLSLMGVKSTLAPSGGEKLYCQYYNKRSRTSLFAFEYLRVPG